jgi:hypothetical protein
MSSLLIRSESMKGQKSHGNSVHSTVKLQNLSRGVVFIRMPVPFLNLHFMRKLSDIRRVHWYVPKVPYVGTIVYQKMKLDEIKVGFASVDFLTLLISLCTIFD